MLTIDHGVVDEHTFSIPAKAFLALIRARLGTAIEFLEVLFDYHNRTRIAEIFWHVSILKFENSLSIPRMWSSEHLTEARMNEFFHQLRQSMDTYYK